MGNGYLQAAEQYAALGWRVLPIPAGGKAPRLPKWQEAATTDSGLIRQWWQQWPGDGVGIATGGDSRLVVLDIDVSGTKTGLSTLAELEAKHGPLPETWTVRTGSGGLHYYYLQESGEPLRNGKLGQDIDVRASGGQVLAPPTIHPITGAQYTIENGTEPQPLPEWVHELLKKPVAAPVAPAAGPTDDNGPAGAFNHRHSWEELLTADGWRIDSTIGSETRWTRPGVTGDTQTKTGVSATTGHGGRDVLKVFTSSVPGLEPDGAYSKFGYWAATRYNGDRSATATQLLGQGYGDRFDPVGWLTGKTSPPIEATGGSEPGEPAKGHGWEPLDIEAALAEDYRPPEPETLARSDGRNLLYVGRINALIGESGSGKSWISQAAIAERLNQKQNVLVIDLEDHYGSYIARLIALGIHRETLREHFTYIAPEQALGTTAAGHLANLVTERDIRLAVIDSTGEAMALQGSKPNDDDDTARWFRLLPRFLANLGPAVLLLDHLPKSTDAPTGFAIGSQRKRAAIDGAMYRVEVGVAPVRGKVGKLKLVCAKDRAGYWQHGSAVAEVLIADTETGTVVRLNVPPDPNRPTGLMGKVSAYLANEGPASRTQIAGIVKGKRDYLYKAIDSLIAEGYAQEKRRAGRGGGTEVHSVRPFVDTGGTDWIDSETVTRPTPPNYVPSEKTGLAEDPKPNYVNSAPHTYNMGAGDIVRVHAGTEETSELCTGEKTENREPDLPNTEPDLTILF